MHWGLTTVKILSTECKQSHGAHVCMCTCWRINCSKCTGGLLDTLGCSRSVASAGFQPFRVKFTVSKGSQLAFFFFLLMSLADPRQMPQGTGLSQGVGEGSKERGIREKNRGEAQRERTGLMRSVIHRHPGGHTLGWGNTTYVLTRLAHNSLGLPRLQGAP